MALYKVRFQGEALVIRKKSLKSEPGQGNHRRTTEKELRTDQGPEFKVGLYPDLHNSSARSESKFFHFPRCELTLPQLEEVTR